MKKRDVVRRIICMMLALTLLFAALPMNVLAAEVGAIANNSEDPDINSTNTGNSNTSTNGGVDTPSEPNKYPTSSGTLPEDQNNPNDELIGDIITTEDGYRIQMNGDGESYSIIEYFGVSKNVVIPSSYRGKPITKILDSAFYGNKTAQKITIPESVVFIGEYTFYNLSESYVYNEYGQGKYIGSTNNPYYYFVAPKDKNATEITLHDDTAIVGSYAFAECENIKTVTIGNNVISMGYAVFGKDSKVENITIPFIGENGKTEYNSHFGYIFGARTTGGNISYVPLTLKSVTINGGSYIKQNAMYGVDMIESLTLPFLGATINDTENNYLSYVFGGSTYDDNIIPQTLTKIAVLAGELGYGAFYDCIYIEEVVIGNGVTSIGDYAFNDCESLTSVKIGESVKRIGSNAFNGCASLVNINVPNSVEDIGDYALPRTDNVNYYEYDNGYYLGNESNPYLVFIKSKAKTINSCVIHEATKFIHGNAFQSNEALTKIIIPDNVKSIGIGAFYKCYALTDIVFGENTSYIGKSAFAYCYNLVSITIPESITVIDERAFEYCYNLFEVINYSDLDIQAGKQENGYVAYYAKEVHSGESKIDNVDGCLFYSYNDNNYLLGYYGTDNTTIVMPDYYKGEVYSINRYAFYGCSSLKSLTIGEGATSIGLYAFYGCAALEDIKFNAVAMSGLSTNAEAFYRAGQNGNGIKVTIGKNVTKVPSNLFYAYSSSSNAAKITSVEVEEGSVCDSIGSSAFGKCSYITSVVITDIASIESSAFSGCTSLNSVVIGKGVKIVGSSAFSGCTKLKNITIGEDVVGIETSAFYNCTALEEIVFNATNMEDLSGSNSVFYKAGQSGNGITVRIGTEVQKIPANLFNSYGSKSYAPKITTVVFENGGVCESIGAYSFAYCSYLVSINIPESVKLIGEYAFRDCSKLGDVGIPNSIEIIGNEAFYNCTSIGYNQYDNAYYLGNATNPYVVLVKAVNSNITSCNIHASAKVIYKNAFKDCKKLTSLVIPNGVTAIGIGAFSGCTTLATIAVPNSLKELGSEAFNNCNALTFNEYNNAYYLGSDSNLYIVLVKAKTTSIGSCSINENTKFIYDSAFENCTKLTAISIPDNVTHIGTYAFYRCTALTEVTIPKSVTKIDRVAFYGCSGLAIIKLNASLDDANIGNQVFDGSGNNANLIIGKEVVNIPSNFFYYANIVSVEFEDGSKCERIGNYAFAYCDILTSIEIPDSVKHIGEKAFYYCTALESLVIGNGITVIEVSAFEKCTALTEAYYNGTEDDWYDKVSISNGNDTLKSALKFTVAETRSEELSTVAYSIREKSLARNLNVVAPTNEILALSNVVSTSTDISFSEGLKYKSNRDGTCSVIGIGTFNGTNLVIPEYAPNGEKVISIGDSAFENLTNISTVVIPDSVITINSSAFAGCTALQNLIIGEGVRHIKSEAFYNCASLGELTIPDSVVSIGSYAFYGCKLIQSLTIGKNVEIIESGAFYGCNSIESITIPDEVDSIGYSAFYGCTSLKKLIIGKNVSTIDDNAFYNCTALEEIHFNATAMSNLYSSNNVFYKAGQSGNGIEVVIGCDVTQIPSYLFCPYTSSTSYAPKITSLEFEEGSVCRVIGESAFYNCSSLLSIEIPSNVATIGSGAFESCTALECIKLNATLIEECSYAFNYAGKNGNGITVIVGNNVTIIPEWLFGYYSGYVAKVVAVEFEEGSVCKSIGDSAFYNCTSLVSIMLPDSVTTIGSYAFSECKALNSLIIGANVKAIGTSAFYNCSSLKDVVIPNTVTTMGAYAFYGCKQLENIVIGENLEKIESETFYNCTSLSTVAIPDSVTSIGDSAFYGCTSLKDLSIGKGVIDIADYAFYNCITLEKIVFNAIEMDDLYGGNYIFYRSGQNGTGVKVIIGEEVTQIPSHLFNAYNSKSSAPKITSIEFAEDSVCGRIGYYSFAYCDYLTDVNMSDGLKKVDDYAFYNCSSLKNLTLSEGLTSIGEYAFYNCTSLISLTIPRFVETIETYAFYNCTALEEIKFNAEQLADFSGPIYNYSYSNNYVFYKAGQSGNGINVIIGNKVTKIPAHLFDPCGDSYYSPKITSVEFEEDSVCNSIGARAFAGCKSLKVLHIGEAVTTIGNEAFCYCAALEEIYFNAVSMNDLSDENCAFSDAGESGSGIEIIIGAKVKKIPAYLFYPDNGYNPKIASVQFANESVCVSIGEYSFAYCGRFIVVDMPNTLTTISESAFESCTVSNYNEYDNAYYIGNSTNPYVVLMKAKNTSITSCIIHKDTKAIYDYAFENCYSITEITIPEGVTSVGARAFYGCSKLEEITIPNSLTSLGEEAFFVCYELSYNEDENGYYLGNSSNPYVVLMEVKDKNVTSYVINEKVKFVYDETFSSCTALESVIIPNGVLSIGRYAFTDTDLTSITIPESVISLGYGAFADCALLELIYFNAKNMNDKSSMNCVFYRAGQGGDGLKVVIGSKVTKIPAYLFYTNNSTNAPKITNVEFENGSICKIIGDSAFYNCISLANVIIPNSVVTIGANAFKECTGLNSLTIGEGVKNIGSDAFFNCVSLEKLYYNAVSMDDFGKQNYLFYKGGHDGDGIEITIGNKVSKIPTYLFYSYDSNYVPKIVSVEFTSGSVCESIGAYAFYDCEWIEVVKLPQSIKNIGYGAFEGCSGLKSVHIEDIKSWCKMSANSFAECYHNPIYYAKNLYLNGSLLTELTIPQDVDVIPDYAFYGCSSLKSIIIPNSVVYIGGQAFYECSNVEYIYFDANTPDSQNTFIQNHRFSYVGNDGLGVRLVIGANVSQIGSNDFSNSKITVIEFESGSKCSCIGENAFYNCTSLVSVEIPSNILNVGEGAFSYCTALESISFNATNMNDLYSSNWVFNNAGQNGSGIIVRIGKNVTKIPAYLFYSSSNIPKISGIEFEEDSSCESIGSYAFYGCSYVSSVTMPNSVSSIGENAFGNCTSLESVNIPENVVTLGNSAFYNCTALEEINFNAMAMNDLHSSNDVFYKAGHSGSGIKVVIGNKVTKIPAYMFNSISWSDYAPKITIIEFATESICNNIGAYAFAYCDDMTSISIPESITSIGTGAFSNCNALNAVRITNIEKWASISFVDSSSNPLYYAGKLYLNDTLLTKLIIPQSITEIGAYTFSRCTSITEIILHSNVLHIAQGAFYGCNNLESITLPFVGEELNAAENNVLVYIFGTSYHTNTSYVPSSLKTIIVLEGVTEIAPNAFYGLSGIARVTLPNSVKKIGSNAFYGCTGLAEINYEGEKNEWRHIIKASNWDAATEKCYTLNCQKADSGFMMESDTMIAHFWVSGYNGEENNVSIPAQYSGRQVNAIYEKAFDNKSQIISVDIPNSIAYVGNYAFRNCVSLSAFAFPEGVVFIGGGVFEGCESLSELVLTFVGSNIGADNNEYFGYYFGGTTYKDHKSYVPSALRKVRILFADEIPAYYFYNCADVSIIELPSGVLSIGESAFEGCYYLSEMLLPESVNTIGDYAFSNCASLQIFELPDNVSTVGEMIFNGCNNIVSVTIGKSLETIADYEAGNLLFGLNKSNSMLIEYVVSEENPKFTSDEYGVLYRKMDIPYTKGTQSVRVEILDVPVMANLSGYTIPDHIVSIAPYAFAYNVTLRMIDLTYVRNISNNAFYQASNLINVTLGTPVYTEFEQEDDFSSAFERALTSIPDGEWEQVYSQYIGDSAFRGCSSLLKIDIDTDNIVGIGDYAFADCPNLKTIMLGKNIEKLGLAVFSSTANGDSNVERFVVDDENVHFKSIDGVLYCVNLDRSLTLEIFPAAAVELDLYDEPMYDEEGNTLYKKTFDLPSGVYVKAIQTYAFQGTKHLLNINICPEDDLIVGDYAFANSSVQNIYIGENVVSLGLIRGEGEYSVFSDADYLTSIEVDPNNDYYSSYDGVLFDKSQRTLIKFPAAKFATEYTVPNTVQTIASMAFKRNQTLERVNINSYISTVGLEAFYACKKLKIVSFVDTYAPLSVMENAFTTFVEIEDGDIDPETAIGYSLGYYYDGESGEIGWENYANTYKLIDNSSGEVVEPSPEVDRNNFYAIVVLDTEGTQLGNMLVSLTDPYGKTETVRTGYGTEGTGTAMFYDLAGVEGLGFALDFTQPYIIKVADQRGVYYTYESTSVYLDEDMRITYITLERKPCDISFNVNGGVGHIDTMDILIDGNYAIANEQVSRTGYTLAGWGTSPDGVVKYTDFFSTSKYKAHYILYAIWQPNTNTVHFDTNTGVGSMSDITVKTDASVTLPENVFTKEGYEFIGWALTPNGGVVYADNGVFTSGVDSEYTLYAKWKGNENLFQFTAGGGEGSMDTGTVVTDEYTTVPQNGFTRAGYTFVDWVDDNGTHWNPGDSYKGTTKPVQTLTAQWVANTGTLRFDANGGSGTMASIELKTDDSITLPKTEFGKLGYVMIGWATTSDGAPSYDSRVSYKMPPVENGEVVTLYAVWAKGPAMHGVACDLADINTQTFDLNKAQYDYYCPISGTHNHEEGVICENGTLHEVVRISVIVYCDTSLGYSLVGKDGVADAASGLYQNGNKVAGVSDVFVNTNGTAIVYFDVPVYTLLSEVDIVASLVLVNEHEEKAKCETVLNIHVFEFSVTEDDVDLETDAINVDLSLAGEAFEKLFGSDSFDISLGKNVKFTTEIDGDTIELLLKASKSYSKTSVTGDYKKGYTDNHGNHNKNTYFFQYKGTVKDSDGVKHELVYNIRFARATETDNYYYYRCYVYEGNYNNKITEFYGAVNGLSKQKSTRAELAPKAYLIYQSYHLSAKNVKDIDKIKKLGSDAHYIEGVQKAPHIENKHSFDMGLEGRLVFQYDIEKGLTPVSSRIKGTMEYTFNHNSQFVVWVIPIVLEVEVKVGGEIVLNISFDEDRKVTFDDTTLTLTASLNASAGVGCSVASFGVYGSIGTVFVLDIYPEFGIESWKANGEIGGYVKVLFKKYSKKFASFDGYIIEPKDQQQAMMLMSTYDMAAMYLIDNYTNAEASELENDFKLIVIDGMLYKLEYMDASSLEGYDAYNYAKLCISSWDGEKWSDPTIIDDNGRNDAAYSIYNHDGVLVLTYTQVADILTANDDNYESFDNLVIKTIPLTTQSIATIGEGNVVDTSIERDYYVYLAQYAIVEGIPTLVWVENADNNAFGVSPDNYIDANGISHVFATTANSIWVSKFENGTWGTPISIASGLSAVTDVAIGTDGDIAYIVDTNGNLADMTDRVMFFGNMGDTISAYNHISVGSIISVDFADGEFVYYYDLVNEDEENIDGLRTLSGIEGSGDRVESYPAEVPADYKVVEDAEGNVIAAFFFSTKTWEHYGEKVSGSALYGIFKQDGVWGKPIEIIGTSNESGVRFETTMDRYIYSFDVIVTPSEDSALMISVSTVDQNGCYLENYDFIYRMEGRIVVDNYEVNYADSTVSIAVRNVGARTSEVYVSIGNGYLLIDEALASGEIKTYTVSLYGNADRKYTVSIDGDKIGTPDWTSEELNLNYSDIVPYAKQLLIGGKNVLLLAVKNTGNTVDTGITVIRVGEHMDNAIISAEILNAISNLTLNDGESAIVEITNENGEKEKIWVGKNVVDAYGIAYHEVMLSDLCSENIGIISIATIVTDNEKGVAVDNNFTHVSYNECVGSLEEGENVEYKPTIFENTLEFDQQNDDGVELNYTYSADDSVLEVYVDQIKVSNELYENTINGTRGTIVLHLELLNSLSKGTHNVTLNFASENTCEIELKVVSYYTVTLKDGDTTLEEVVVKEGTVPLLPTEFTKPAENAFVYAFEGWDIDGDGDIDNVTAITEDITYQAVWKQILREYEITWVMTSANGEKVSITEKYNYYETPQYMGTIFVPDGMQFVSWNTEIEKVTQNCTYTAQYEQERQIGDINGDGVINTRDVAMLRQYVVGKIELSEDVLMYCNIYNDYNDDGSVKINTRDVALLQQIVVGTSN